MHGDAMVERGRERRPQPAREDERRPRVALWSSEDVACATAIRVMRGYDDPVGSVRLPQLRPLEGASVSYSPITEIDGVNALPMTVKILLEGLVRAAAL